MKFLGKCVVFLLAVVGMSFAGAQVWAGQPHESLVPLLVNLDGWKADAGTGMSLASDTMKMITAHRSYNKGKKQQIVVDVLVNSGPPPAHRLKESVMENEEKIVRTSKIDGFWVSTTNNNKTKVGEVYVVLSQNSQTHALIIFRFINLDEKEAMEIAKKFNWKTLEKATSKLL
ncbi:MAG: hypothetical protein KKG47_10830 [Proteobacteria bacterium]|nr:hypothetical protein [Pseudomonadota bacterium]MBU1738598.1 hypothetical protein [Pseudomonadota bacterium]